MMDYFVTNSSLAPAPTGIQSTAGAVPVRNDKGEVSMKKVKVHRYVSGKRPDYAPTASTDEESDDDDFLEKRRPYDETEGIPDTLEVEEQEKKDDDDPRLRRLTRIERTQEDEEEFRAERRRRIQEPEVLVDESEEIIKERIRLDSSESSDEEDLSDEEIERRRESLKQKVLSRKDGEEELIKEDDEDEKSGESSESSSEYEEFTDSEEETGPRLKPVFVRKRDRITVMEKEKEAQKQKQAEIEAKKMTEERKKYSLKMVEESIKLENQVRTSTYDNVGKLEDVNTDNENDELVYESWKLRELKRTKRDRDERETLEKERAEVERLRNMTEEERKQEARINPKIVTNKAAKGKYKFLQKYYHRGAFYLDKEDTIFKRDFSGATLEDQFDKTILPKVMQVKNFGRSGRSKYTHLVDQDTTVFDSPWISETAQNLKIHSAAAGVKQVYERPSKKRKN